MSDLLPRLSAALATRYTIERELGRGGMAIVFLAQDLKHRRRVALKVFRPELTSALGPDRFLREIEIAAQFTHPHILPVFDSGEADGFLYYVMPYVIGESLRRRLSREGRLPIDDAIEIAYEVADALAYAHIQGIVHRDIKPENILLEEGHAIVADFGIARAISAAARPDDHATEAGLVVGTPLYMSPEQAVGESRLDGRADIYSLGCVLYEMLAGEPPFMGATHQAIAVQHVQDTPPPVRVKRPGVPAPVERAVARALAKLPADRFATAAEFAAAIPHHETPTEPQVPTLTMKAIARRRRTSRVLWALGGAGTLAAALTATAFHRRGNGSLDASLYMVLPFQHREQSAPVLLNGDQCESLLHEALARWDGVQMVDPLWVTDARSRRGGATGIQAGLAIARQRRAGRVVSGEVWQFRDTIYVRGVLYDAGGSARLIREQAVRIALDLSDAQARFQELADSLLIGGGLAHGAPPRGGGRPSLPAWHAFQDGYAALQRWHLDSAKAGLQHALAIEPTYGVAQLWLAQVLAWSGDPPASWKGYAAGALASPDSLGSRDRGVAEGMFALAEGRFPQACEKFRALISRDSLDFAAWFGLGDCQAKDPLVVPDSASPSGWRFRGSYHGAVSAYRRALEIVPSVHQAFRGDAFVRLPELLYAESNRIRQGYALTPDTARFGAFPSMAGDTLEFVPRRLADVVAGRPGAIPPTVSAAVSRNRELLRGIATTWVQVFPNSADAHETFALALETLGELTSGRSKDVTAFGEIRRASTLASERSQALRLANAETRFLVKSGQMSAARALADSVLRANPEPSPEGAQHLRGLAALIGRVHAAASLQQRAAPDVVFRTWDWQPVDVPVQLTDAALALLAYASFAVPADSVAALEARIDRLIPSYVEPRLRKRTREALLDLPGVLAFPERGVGPTHRAVAPSIYLLEMQWSLAQGYIARLRAQFDTLRELRASKRPGDVAFDATYHEAQLLLALGDTTAATHLLDLSLEALPTLGSHLLDQVPQIATLVRGMALRAVLAHEAKDSKVAKHWAALVATLWSQSDPELRSVVDRMRGITAHDN